MKKLKLIFGFKKRERIQTYIPGFRKNNLWIFNRGPITGLLLSHKSSPTPRFLLICSILLVIIHRKIIKCVPIFVIINCRLVNHWNEVSLRSGGLKSSPTEMFAVELTSYAKFVEMGLSTRSLLSSRQSYSAILLAEVESIKGS